MATITIKIESEQLAREVLTQLGYLPDDNDVPDLVSVEDEEPEAKEKVMAAPATEEWCPEPNDEGFGTPLDQTGSIDLGDLSKDGLVEVIDRIQKRKGQEMKDVAEAISMGLRNTPSSKEAALEKKKNTQKNYLKVAASMKEQLTPGQYMQFLEAHESDPNIDPDLKQVAYQLILHEKAKAQDDATKEAALKDEGYRNYIENVEPISYEDYLK